VVTSRCTADFRISRRLPGWLSADAVAISVFKLPTNASAVPHVRVTRRSFGVHGHWELVNELTVALPVSLALRFLQLESMYEHEQVLRAQLLRRERLATVPWTSASLSTSGLMQAVVGVGHALHRELPIVASVSI
jgi:hypothetical protein